MVELDWGEMLWKLNILLPAKVPLRPRLQVYVGAILSRLARPLLCPTLPSDFTLSRGRALSLSLVVLCWYGTL